MGLSELLRLAGENSGFLFVILIVWVFLLTLIIVWLFWKTRRFIIGVNKGNLVKLIDSLIQAEKGNTNSLKVVKSKVAGLKKDGVFHIQKLGLTKYNPFKEVGGDHSFSLTLLDGNDDGLILTGLHTRDRTRVYLKEVKKGGAKIELSAEEKKSLKEAQKVL